MANDEPPKDGQATQIIKAGTPAWKASPSLIKGLIVIAIGAAAVLIYTNPWKKEPRTSEQTATQSGSRNTLNQAGRDSVQQSVGPNNSGPVGQIANSPGASVNFLPMDRHIDPAQRKIMLDNLHSKPGESIVVVYGSSDPEASAFAEDFIDTLKTAGFKTGDNNPMNHPANYSMPGATATGITVCFKSDMTNAPQPNMLSDFHRALRLANIKANWIDNGFASSNSMLVAIGRK